MPLEDDDVATCLQELSWLRKRDGFTQPRLVQAPIVDELLRGSLDDSFERMRHRFTSAIHSLEEDQANLLLDIFGLSLETAGIPQLMVRREIHGQKIGRKVDTVRTREEAALKQLHSRLVTGRYAQAPLVLDVPEMHGGIIYEETSTLIVVNDKFWEATYEHYRFANMAGELDYVTIGRSYPGEVTPHPKGDFKVNTRPVDGAGWADHFWHINKARTATEPMQDQTRYDLRFRVTPLPDSEAPEPITLASRAFHTRSSLGTIQVRFIGTRPATIWRFEDASPFARPHTANEYNTIQLDNHGVATLTGRDLHGGLFRGFAWQW